MAEMPPTILPTTLEFFDHVYSHTHYENTDEANNVFSQIRTALPKIAQTRDGYKLIQKFYALSRTVSAEGPFRDMIKIVWRMVKPMSASVPKKVCLFFLSLGTIIDVLKTSALKQEAGAWIEKIEVWLGNQLTIGGKGVTGEGEGSVLDRLTRFFSTPYLHDFD